jgi:ketosteroid isomerase-like protein
VPYDANVALLERYLTALSTGAGPDELDPFFQPDVVQEKFPNRITPNGAVRDLQALKDGQTLAARLGVFFEFRDGRIARPRNYDCINTW